MKKEKIILSLPCKMNLSDFTNDHRGIHCGNCDKVLTDFRGKSDEEAVEIVRNSTRKICGVFDPVQVDYKSSTLVIPAGIQRFGLSLLGILGFLGPVLTSCSDNEAVADSPAHDKIRKAFNNLKFPMRIEGVLKNESTGEIMSFANVTILQNGKVIKSDQTDKDGNFSIFLERGDLIKENFEFAVKKDGFADTLDKSALIAAKGQKLQLTVQAKCSSASEMEGETIYVSEHSVQGYSIPPLPPPPPPPTEPAPVREPAGVPMISPGEIRVIEKLDPVQVGKPAIETRKEKRRKKKD